jgi:hypothetical protein
MATNWASALKIRPATVLLPYICLLSVTTKDRAPKSRVGAVSSVLVRLPCIVRAAENRECHCGRLV